MDRLSQLHVPTLRNDPADAEAPSHRLLVRGGYARQVGAGLFSFLPLGWRVHQKIVQIVREEMNAIGAQEMLAPLLAPAELWQESGRYDIPELFRLKDRHGRDLILSLTHEETMTFHARELNSYRQLPQLWYHFQTKGRDEARPRAGLLRVREFVMKDSYSFDRDEDGLDVSYWKHAEAYRKIFDRCGLRYLECEGNVGLMGGEVAHEYLAPCSAGENEIALCEKGDYAANVEAARSVSSAPEFPERLDAPREIDTPEIRTIEELAEFLSIDPRATAKAMPVVGPDGKLVLGLVRGDHRLHELKLAAVLGGEFRPAHPEEIEEAFGATGGSLGPVGVELRVIADEALREGQFISGANKDGFHLLGVEAGRDYQPEFADIRAVVDGDACIHCGGSISVEPAIEIGNIFKLGTRYSEPLHAVYLDESGKERPIVMGSYGIGPGRVLAAAIEQNHDDKRILWPRTIAPFDIEVVALRAAGEEILTAAEAIGAALSSAGYEVLLDDRDARPGEKFADADLIGAPLRITVGKKMLEDGGVDLRVLASADERRVAVAEVAAVVAELLA
ncbi:MAG: proline--tRNA ligase [Gaiellaceae bacterium]|jgi:prolyl-tRNA synthetase